MGWCGYIDGVNGLGWGGFVKKKIGFLACWETDLIGV